MKSFLFFLTEHGTTLRLCRTGTANHCACPAAPFLYWHGKPIAQQQKTTRHEPGSGIRQSIEQDDIARKRKEKQTAKTKSCQQTQNCEIH